MGRLHGRPSRLPDLRRTVRGPGDANRQLNYGVVLLPEIPGDNRVRIAVRVRRHVELAPVGVLFGHQIPEVLQGQPAARVGAARVQGKELGNDQAFWRIEACVNAAGALRRFSAAVPSTLETARVRAPVSAARAAVVAGLRPADEAVAADRDAARRRAGAREAGFDRTRSRATVAIGLIAVVAKLIARDDAVAATGRADRRLARALEARLHRARRRAPIAARRSAVVARLRWRDDAVTADSRQVLIDRVGARVEQVIGGGGVARYRTCPARLCLGEGRKELLFRLLEALEIDGGAREYGFRMTLGDRSATLPAGVDLRGGALLGRIGARGGDRCMEDEEREQGELQRARDEAFWIRACPSSLYAS